MTKSVARFPRALALAAALGFFGMTGCAFLHHFTEPARDWQSRTGQLQYKNKGQTVTGEVIVRTSSAGDFELTFAKGPVTLLVIQQDEKFARATGAFARMGWSGPVANAPKSLRGWLTLRARLMRAPNERVIRHQAGPESFQFRF
jgi:hypothetical protein